MTTRPMTECFYSAPIDALVVRRGAPLGMRAIADEMADQLAPGLTAHPWCDWIGSPGSVVDCAHCVDDGRRGAGGAVTRRTIRAPVDQR